MQTGHKTRVVCTEYYAKRFWSAHGMMVACLYTNCGVEGFFEFLQDEEGTNYIFSCCGAPQDLKNVPLASQDKECINFTKSLQMFLI